MTYASLYDLIIAFQRRTKLHIGVSFFEEPQNELLRIPRPHAIHSAPVCDYVKVPQNDYVLCRECHLRTTDRAIRTRESFFSFCHAGILEYIHPICTDRDVLGIIFIGNMLAKGTDSAPLRTLLAAEPSLEPTLEQDVTREECVRIAQLLESYIHLLYTQSPVPTQSGSLCERIKHFLNNNIEYEPDTRRIGMLLHYNEKYLGRVFKRETGLSISEYRNLRRLNLCCEFLRHSDDSVSSIASRLGFENVSYFNRLFKNHYGLSPTAYRQMHQTPARSD